MHSCCKILRKPAGISRLALTGWEDHQLVPAYRHSLVHRTGIGASCVPAAVRSKCVEKMIVLDFLLIAMLSQDQHIDAASDAVSIQLQILTGVTKRLENLLQHRGTWTGACLLGWVYI